MISQRKAGALLGYSNIIVKNLVNLIYTPLLLSFVGKADYGVYQTSNSFIFALTLLSFGFSESYVRFYTQKKNKGTVQDIHRLNGLYFVLYAVVCLIALALGLLFAANITTFFSASFTASQVGLAQELMTIMAFSVAVTLFTTVFDAYNVAHECFTFQQTCQMATSITTPVIAFLLLNCGMGAVGVAIAQLAVSCLLLFLDALYAIRRLGMRFDFSSFDCSLFKAIASFSAWIFINQICDLVNQGVPNILLGARVGATIVAVYSVSIQIRNVFVSLSTVMSSVFIPKINQIVATSDDNNVLTSLMTRVGRYQMFLFCWIYCGFFLVGRFFILKWAGSQFEDAYVLICAMALPLAVPLCQNTGIEIQRAKNRHKARSLVYLCMAALNVIFTWFMSPMLGYWAPAIAYICSIVLGNGIFMNWYYQFCIRLDMRVFWKKNLPIMIFSAAVVLLCSGAMLFMPVTSWAAFFVWCALYSLCFAGVMWVFVLDSSEKKAVTSRLPYLH